MTEDHESSPFESASVSEPVDPSFQTPVKRKRGRPRKNPVGVTATTVAAKPTADPRSGAILRKDRWYFAQQMSALNRAQDESIKSGAGGVKGYEASLKGIMFEAGLNGVSAESILDGRSDEELKFEAVRLFAERATDIFEFAEPHLDAMLRLMDDIDDLADRHARDLQRIMGDDDGEKLERAVAAGKQMRSLIQKLREIRERARQPSRPGRGKMLDVPKEAQKAAHPLRFMAYVMRAGGNELQPSGGGSQPASETSPSSDRPSRRKPSDGDSRTVPSSLTFLEFKLHHAKLAWNAYCAKHRCEIDVIDYVTYKHAEKYEGSISVIPPGHGKTTFASGYLGLEYCLDPHLRVLYLHSQEDQACQTLQYIANFFKLDNSMGRRREALFPGLRLDKCSSNTFRIATEDRNRQVSCRAYGMKAKGVGSDADVIVFDDPVDPSEREQAEERRRKCDMVGWWMHRLRGKKSYHLTFTTLWHPEDANMTRIRQREEGKLTIRVLILSCGGPEPTPYTKPWESLWPEVWPPSRLKQRFAENPSLYLATFCSDPRPESHQIIKKLRFYDPDAEEHREFMALAECHLSVDPAATARKDADHTAMLYAACGEVVGVRDTEMVHERRLRVLDATKFRATISDMKDKIAGYVLSHKVDRVHIETQSAFVAIPEMLRNEYGVECVSHTTGNKSKEIRLRAVGVLIDDTRTPGMENGGAVVEFPGVWVHGKDTLQPDPRFGWVYEQILRFGSMKQDDICDALTQLCAWLARTGELTAGAGWVTQKARAAVMGSADESRLRRMFEEYSKPKVNKSVEQEDAEFVCAMSWN